MLIVISQISEIRQLFVTVEPSGKSSTTKSNLKNGSNMIGPIDFDNCVMVRPACHVIACRITAENPDEYEHICVVSTATNTSFLGDFNLLRDL